MYSSAVYLVEPAASPLHPQAFIVHFSRRRGIY